MMKIYRLRKALWADLGLLYAWRNDFSTRKEFFSSDEISMEEHESWLKRKFVDSACSIYILEIKGEPIGQARLERCDGAGYISYSISSSFRGQGYGKIILQLLENEVANESISLIGHVKKDNIASQVIFQSLGYEEIETEEFFEYRKIASNVPLKHTDTISGGGIILLTNNRNSVELFHWLEERVPTQIYSEALGLDMLKSCHPDLVVSYNYTHIVSEDVISFMKGNIINLHISYLPWNRGKYPNLWSFIDDTPKGVTIHKLEKGLDTGAIIYQKEMFFDETKETLASSHQKLNKEIVRLFQEHWAEIWARTYSITPQRGKGSYHALKDMKELLHERGVSELDWDMIVGEFKELMTGECANEHARAKEALYHS